MKRSLPIGLMASMLLAGCTTQSAVPTASGTVAPTTVSTAAPASASPVRAKPAPAAPVYVSDEFGVEVLGVHLSAADFVIDVRYKVIDPARATPLLDRQVHPVLVDEKTGTRYYVPNPPIVGALRQTNRGAPIALNKVYFMMFANPDRRLKAGDAVALYLGDRRFGDLVVAP